MSMRDELNQANKVISKLQKRVAELETGVGPMEAAEWHESLARSKLEQAKQAPEAQKRRFLDISFFHDECAIALRARAADRSEK